MIRLFSDIRYIWIQYQITMLVVRSFFVGGIACLSMTFTLPAVREVFLSPYPDVVCQLFSVICLISFIVLIAVGVVMFLVVPRLEKKFPRCVSSRTELRQAAKRAVKEVLNVKRSQSK